MKSTETESRSLRSAGRVAGLHGTETKSDAVHSRRSDGNARSDDKISPIHCIRSLLKAFIWGKGYFIRASSRERAKIVFFGGMS